MLHFNLMPVMVLALLGSTQCSQPSVNDFQIYAQLEEALIKDNYTAFVLAQTFYPNIGSQPICIPVNYYLDCNESLHFSGSYSSGSYFYGSYNASFLWTTYDVDEPIGPLLLSYSRSGIVLRGFDWEDACLVHNPIEILLNVCSLNLAEDEPSIFHALQKITAVLKGYAKEQGEKLDLGASDTSGYAIHWNEDQRSRLFRTSSAILTTIIVVLNIFLIFLAIAMTNYTYDILYKNIKWHKEPGYHPAGYPIFWSIAFLSIFWNVAPSWLVLEHYGSQIYYSLGFMVPAELLIAIILKKKSDFPVPLPCHRGCRIHKGKHSSIDPAVLKCCSCLLNHFYQVVAIWSIFVFLTFVVYYYSSVIVAFYLSPVQTLVKLVFLKAVAVCVVVNVALVISVSRFTLPTTPKACKHNIISAVSVIATIMLLPIIAFLAFIIGGILFSNSNQGSGIQAVLTIFPSIFLVVAAWFSRGHLFPTGIQDESNPAKEILSDLESGSTQSQKSVKATHQDPVPATTVAMAPVSTPSNSPQSGELSNYNSVSSHNTNETSPLLTKPTVS